MELISRVKALLRRTEKEDDGDTLACGSIEIDNKRHSEMCIRDRDLTYITETSTH